MMFVIDFFFSSRRRHTRCALVTGVQTCALPISLAAKPYYENLVGDMADRTALILDPIPATGGTLVATVDMLKAAGATRIKGLFLVAAPEGLKALEASHPDVEVYTASIDERLNEQGYILPGLGYAGDKVFGTRVST